MTRMRPIIADKPKENLRRSAGIRVIRALLIRTGRKFLRSGAAGRA
jgi:hypothetical protein